MHRSASTSRASDEFVINISPQMKGSPGLKMAALDQLPTYDPLFEVSKKESSRLKWAENAVHFIPLVLIVCGFILWFFSRPAVDANEGTAIVARIEGLTLYGDANRTHTYMPAIKTELEPLERIVNDAAERSARMFI
ncbi:hypothetical protein MRB53_004847 [Persea americana]|uniref:Uncharacterized protein n=1 Tax=Persea americana TaxID=3435 RepID=A0ACC2MBV7_PERAE|nr:hypothetical protein MRB53_004847 [Persea americana]